jgi:hypothetical protein
MAMNKSKSATDQVCELRILVIPLLILPIVLLHYVISFMFPTLLKTSFRFTNFHEIMTSSLNTILGIFLLRTDSRGEAYWTVDVSRASIQSSPPISLRSSMPLQKDLLPTLIGMHALDILQPQ